MGYRKYDPMVKKMIIETGNRHLYPELNIPRTTINYWIKESKTPLIKINDFGYKNGIKNLKEDIYKLKAKNLILTKCLEKLTKEFNTYDKKAKENRKFVIEIIDSFREVLPLKEIIILVGISQTTYYRWRVEVHGCKFQSFKKCVPRSPNQLTRDEQLKLVKYATDVNFKKFSTVSLMHYCKRKNLIHASLEL